MWHPAKKAYRYLPVPFQKGLIALYGRMIRNERFGPEQKELERLLEESEKNRRDIERNRFF